MCVSMPSEERGEKERMEMVERGGCYVRLTWRQEWTESGAQGWGLASARVRQRGRIRVSGDWGKFDVSLWTKATS